MKGCPLKIFLHLKLSFDLSLLPQCQNCSSSVSRAVLAPVLWIKSFDILRDLTSSLFISLLYLKIVQMLLWFWFNTLHNLSCLVLMITLGIVTFTLAYSGCSILFFFHFHSFALPFGLTELSLIYFNISYSYWIFFLTYLSF